MITKQARRMLQRAVLSVGLLAMIIPAALANPPTDRIARERYACSAILGLNQSTGGYDACVGSLDRSLSAPPQGNAAAACAYAGTGSTECADELRNALWNQELLGGKE